MNPSVATPLKALLIEDNPGDIRLLRELIAEGARDVLEIFDAGTLREAVGMMEKEPFDVILLDLSLPDASGMDGVLRTRQTVPETPVVVLTGLQDEEFALRALREGAQDYLIKGQIDPDRLVRSVRYSVERMTLERELRHSQKRDVIDNFSAGISHDFNNVLSLIRGNVEIARMGDLPESADRYLQRVLSAVNSAEGIVRQLLVFSGKQVLRRKPVGLNRLVHRIADQLRQALPGNIRLLTEEDPTLPEIPGDAGMLERVLINLAFNARDAMPNGGDLVLRTSRTSVEPRRAHRYPDARPGEFACISVSDQGTGIEPKVLTRIFEPFFTTKKPDKGTGLGLASAYGIAKQHGGWIEVESKTGEGSVFTVFLPLDGIAFEAHAANAVESLSGPDAG